MSAIEPAPRGRHVANAGELFRAVEEIVELPGGYAFRLPNDADTLRRAAEFVSLERLCCPFLGFVMEVEPEGGPVWLRLNGRTGVKAFISEEVGGLLGVAINWTAEAHDGGGSALVLKRVAARRRNECRRNCPLAPRQNPAA